MTGAEPPQHLNQAVGFQSSTGISTLVHIQNAISVSSQGTSHSKQQKLALALHLVLSLTAQLHHLSQ